MKKMHIEAGEDLEKVVLGLLEAKKRGESVYCIFNGGSKGSYILYSDTVTMDLAFLQVLGKSKAEADRDVAMREMEYDFNSLTGKLGKDPKKRIAEIIGRGYKVISQDKWQEWTNFIIKDLDEIDNLHTTNRNLFELENAVTILEALDAGVIIEDIKKMCEDFTFFYVSLNYIVKNFSSRSNEFIGNTTSYQFNEYSKLEDLSSGEDTDNKSRKI